MKPEQIARVCHEANRAYCEAIGDQSQLPWDEAAQWQRDSALEGVTSVARNPREQHEAWCESKRKDGWIYGLVKDGVLKTHPCLVAYEQLPLEQQLKDTLFQAIVEALT